MTQPDVWLKGGLFTPKHWHSMGEAIWLYGYLLQRANFHDDADRGEAGTISRYTHDEAVDHLGCSLRTAKYWFSRLLENGYIEAKSHGRMGLELKITKYTPLGDRVKQRRAHKSSPPAETEVQDIALDEVQDSALQTDEVQHEVQCKVQDIAPCTLDQQINRSTNKRQQDPPKRAATPGYAVFAKFCEETGILPAGVPENEKGRRMKMATQIAKAGYTPDQAVRCFRFLRQQHWRQGQVKIDTVAREIADWVAAGEPPEPPPERAKGNGSTRQRAEAYGAGGNAGSGGNTRGRGSGTKADPYAYDRALMGEAGNGPGGATGATGA